MDSLQINGNESISPSKAEKEFFFHFICVTHTRGKIGMNQTVGKHCEIGTFCMQNIVNIVKWGYFVCDTIEQGFN